MSSLTTNKMTSMMSKDEISSLTDKIYSSARDGMAVSIFALLWNMDKCVVREVLSHSTEEKGQRTTPLIIAAMKGEEKVVSLLLTHFDVDIEQTGTVMIDGFTIQGATPLWCAAGTGHFSIVKLLVEHGADINHGTASNSTPLRAACFDNRIEIVRYLVENHADITIANKYDNTCLMISSYKGHKDCVRYLLEKGADPNTIAHCGATALHFAAESGHLDVVKHLVEYGATQKENDLRITPLLVAAECGKSEIVSYFTSLVDCTKEDKITALELLGAFYANDKENYEISNAFKYLEMAMNERFSDPNNIIKKPFYPPVAAYDNHIECKNMSELVSIKMNFAALHMESLAIRERILGPENPEVPHPVIFRGAVFADDGQFDKCISLWMHAMILRHKSNRTISKDISRFSQVFSQIIHLNMPNMIPDFSLIEEVLKYAQLELQREVKIKWTSCEEQHSLLEIYQTNIHTCLYLFCIAAMVLKSEDEEDRLRKAAYRFLKCKPQLKNGYTPLHMVLDSGTLVDKFHVIDVVTFPNVELVRLFVKCGADVNAQDVYGNTPLHVIARYPFPGYDLHTFQQMFDLLIQNGAHIDVCNVERKTALEAAATGVVGMILRMHTKLSLKCLSARAVRKYGLQYQGNVPMILEDFLAIH